MVCVETVVGGATDVNVVEVVEVVDDDGVVVDGGEDVVLLVVVDDEAQVGATPKFCAVIIAVRVPQ